MLAPNRLAWPIVLWSCLFAACSLVVSVAAQASPTPAPSNPDASSQNSSLTTPVTSVSLTTASATISTTIHNGTSLIPTVTVIPVVLNITVTTTPTPTVTKNDTAATATHTSNPFALETKIDPAFGVLGAILILTGIPSAFLGHKNRWTSFFLIGFYSLSLVCLVLILKFGVLQAVNPPSRTLRGLFVLACFVAGAAGGGVSIFFWKATRYFIGAWGGLAFALWIQCFRDGGLIHPIGYRWLMYIACIVVGFTSCTIPKLHYYTVLVSTAFVGATAFILGVDCYATENLKEFYMWNLGFNTLFPKFNGHGIQFPVTQQMQIELGLLGAVALMGIAVQLRILKILHRKLKEIKEEHHRQEEMAQANAAERFVAVEKEKEEWEREHTLTKHGRQDSNFSESGSPFLKDPEAGFSDSEEKRTSTNTLVTGTIRPRYQSGVSSFMAAPLDGRQSPGALPALDLGADIEADVPQSYIAESSRVKEKEKGTRATTPAIKPDVAQELEDLRKKQELLAEIQNIRKSIELLKAETPDPSSSSDSRHPSLTSRRTLSHDLGSFGAAGPSHARPPRPRDPRARVQSMDISSAVRTDVGGAIGRPTSAPLQDDDWEAYVRERKLLQPPSGVTPLIPTTPLSPIPIVPVSPAVAEALQQRQRRESSLSFAGIGISPAPLVEQQPPSASRKPHSPPVHAPEDIPIALRPQHRKNDSQGSYAPGVILPPQDRSPLSPPTAADAPRVMSFEELTERHKEKLRQLQQPVTQTQKEQAEVSEARARWERAKELEKRAVIKRQAEKAAIVSKEAKQKQKSHRAGDTTSPVSLEEPNQRHGHTRSLSADALAVVDGRRSASSKRLSAMKVQEWQSRQQEDVEEEVQERRDLRSPLTRQQSGVPFPAPLSRPQNSRDSHRRHSRMFPDPPS